MGFINENAFAAIKRGATFINLARGELVDEAAVLNALDTEVLARYIADFPSEALIAHDKAVLFPHLGASSIAELKTLRDNCLVSLMQALEKYDVGVGKILAKNKARNGE